MLHCTVLYPNKAGAKFDFDYYLKKHIPLANEILGGEFEVARGLPGPNGEPPAYLCLATIKISSPADFAARNQKRGSELAADLANYTNITPTIQVAETLTG